MTAEGILAVCVSALLITPVMIWLHIRLSRLEERGWAFGWLAMASFLGAWLSVIAFVVTGAVLLAFWLLRLRAGSPP